MCRAVTAGDRLRARGDVAVYVSVRVNHVVADQSPISRRDLTDDVTALDQ